MSLKEEIQEGSALASASPLVDEARELLDKMNEKVRAIQLVEDIVDRIDALTFQIGAKSERKKALVEEYVAELKKLGADDIVVVCGGVIPRQDYDELYAAGAAKIFGPVDFEPYIGMPEPIPGDVDGSYEVDAVDVQLVINEALGIETGGDCDQDENGVVDAVDVQLVINAALAAC